MNASDAFPDEKAIETLQLELELLRIVHHRNKNQLHLQPFFKHLCILKRTIAHLLENRGSEYLLLKLRNLVIPYAWEEFSRVVARGEFVTLGMVLCASVARIGYCLGGIDGVDPSEMMIGDVMEKGEDEFGEIIPRNEPMEELVEVKGIAQEGELVTPSRLTSSRDTDETISEEGVTATEMFGAKSEERHIGTGDILPPTKKRKKKKANDDIDLLFAGL